MPYRLPSRAARAAGVTALLAVVLASAPAAARAPKGTRFSVPDSSLATVVQRPGFEDAWNRLFVTELRLRDADPETADSLLALEYRVARAESTVLGTRIASTALAARERWSDSQRARRISGAVAESLATRARAGGDYAEAERLFLQALADYRNAGALRREAWMFGRLGDVAVLAGDPDHALDYYRWALKARATGDDPRMLGDALHDLGSTALRLGRYPEAAGWLRQAREVRARAGETAELGRTLDALGLAAHALGQPDSARIWLDGALGIAVEGGDSTLVGEVLTNEAVLASDTGEPARARRLAERALAIERTRGDRSAEARLERLVGLQLAREGRPELAAARLGRAVEASEEARDARGAIDALLALAHTWTTLDEPDRARPPLERARALADSVGDAPDGVRARYDLSRLARAGGDLAGADSLAREAFERAGPTGDSTLVHDTARALGELALERGAADEASGWLARAASAGEGLGDDVRGADQAGLGRAALRAGRLDEAAERYGDALAIARRAALGRLEVEALLGLGGVAERRGDPAAALARDREAARRADTLRAAAGAGRGAGEVGEARAAAFETVIHLLQRLEPRFPDSSYAAEAFDWAERARSRTFRDELARDGGPRVEPATLERAQGLLDSGRDALLEYSLGDSGSSLWVVTQNAVESYSLPPRSGLRARATALARGLRDSHGAEAPATRAAARALYRLLVEPAEPALGGVKHLIVVPDGALARFPFEALLTRDVGDVGAPPRGSWLVERWTVSYAPSVTALATRGGPAASGPVLAVADPSFPDRDSSVALPALPATRLELEALEAAAGRRPVTALTGADATRARLLEGGALARAEVVHLATHGEADAPEPGRSGLWLASPDSAGPGFLSAAEVARLHLSAGLVTLSGCETGGGPVEADDGVLELPRAFLVAGARSVLVSLWGVNHRSAALLLRRFYDEALRRGRPLDEALARAERALLRSDATRSPYDWAPFVLVGRSGPIE